MIVEDNRFPTNFELSLVVPCYHGMKTPDRTKHPYGGQILWHSWAISDTLGIQETDMQEAYNHLFGGLKATCKFECGYNEWEPQQDVYLFHISGNIWRNHNSHYSEENLRHNAHAFMLHMVEGVAESASGDDSYFDYVPSEYDAVRHLAFDLNQRFNTEDFTEYPRKIWDVISEKDPEEGEKYPIEFIGTYGERP